MSTDAPSDTDADTRAADAPPRRLTSKAKRRAWAESSVRLWLVLAAVLVIIAGIFVATSVGDYLDERDLILNGEKKIATVVTIQGDRGRYDMPRELVLPAEVQFERDDGSLYTERINLISRPGEIVSVGDAIEIRIRLRATRYETTDRLEPPPLLEKFLPLPILLGMAGVSFALASVRRGAIVGLATHGERRTARVVEQKTSPLAPASKLLRFHYADDDARRVHGLLHPNPAPAKGESFDVYARPGKPGKAVAADLYPTEM